MRWKREEYLALMRFGRPPRPMLVELFGPLVGLDAEWRAQGATEAELDLSAFDFDRVYAVPCGVETGPMLPAPVTMEESAVHLVQRDGLGRILRLDKRTATIPLPENFPVKSMEDWIRLRPLYQWREDRESEEGVARAIAARHEGALVIARIPGAFDTLRELMGEENACLAHYDQPELIEDILGTLGDTAERALAVVTRRVGVDELFVHEDFAGRSGPLVGPEQILRWWRPYYQRAWNVAKSWGARLFQLDTDGNVNAVMGALIECGVNAMLPMEPAAGMDIVACRKRWRKQMAYRGGIDKFALLRGREAIRRELEYKFQLKEQAGIAFGLDHRIPNGTPLEAYRYYVSLARQMLGLPAYQSD